MPLCFFCFLYICVFYICLCACVYSEAKQQLEAMRQLLELLMARQYITLTPCTAPQLTPPTAEECATLIGAKSQVKLLMCLMFYLMYV